MAVSGSGFVDATRVFVGSKELTDMSFYGDRLIGTLDTRNMLEGYRDVTVKNPDGQVVTLSRAFYVGTPAATGTDPGTVKGDDDGCGCQSQGGMPKSGSLLLMALVGLGLLRRRGR
jgi:MYXO-CTERM domain-containing protein